MSAVTASLCSTLMFVVFVSADQKIITAESGQDVTLTCRAPNKNSTAVKWSRADLVDKHVLLYQDGTFDPDDQHPSFKNRVDLQDRQMKDGDVSLILKDVTINDAGTYECRVYIRGTWKSINSTNLHVDPPGPTGGHTEEGGKEDGGKEGRGKEDGGKDGRGKEDGGKEDRGKEDGGKEDRGKEDGGKEGRGKEDGGKEGRGKEDGGKDGRGKEDGGKEGRGKEDGGKDGRGKEDGGKDGRGKEDGGKEGRGKEDGGKEGRGKEDGGKEDRGKKEDGPAGLKVGVAVSSASLCTAVLLVVGVVGFWIKRRLQSKTFDDPEITQPLTSSQDDSYTDELKIS